MPLAWLRRNLNWPAKTRCTNRSRSLFLGVEALEERQLPSATTVPTISGASLITQVSDVLLATLPRDNGSLIFLGDSITFGYANGTGQPIWSSVFDSLGAVDLGAVGQTTQSLLYQLTLGQLAGYSPSVVVLMIGTNNLREGDSPWATANGVLVDVLTIHRYAPLAQVLVLGVPPGGSSLHDPYRAEVQQTNALIQQKSAGDARAMFLNPAAAFENPDGSISTQVLFDYIHPTLLGYARLTDLLAPGLAEACQASFLRDPAP
jgi:beta-glucosidase